MDIPDGAAKKPTAVPDAMSEQEAAFEAAPITSDGVRVVRSVNRAKPKIRAAERPGFFTNHLQIKRCVKERGCNIKTSFKLTVFDLSRHTFENAPA